METNPNTLPTQSIIDFLESTQEGNGGAFTVRSKITGKDYTFKIEKSLYREKMYYWVQVETGYLNFNRIGFYSDGKIISNKEEVTTPASTAICWLLRHLFKKNISNIEANVELFHLGQCIVCGRELTDSMSIESGMGSICRKKTKK